MNPFEPSLSQQDEDTLKTPNPIRNRIEQKLLEQRKIYLWGAVEDRSARYIVERMLYLEAEEPGKDITLYINSPGGVITSGMAIYDTMQMISADVSTVCMGLAASMGALLLCGGAKGKRYAWPHSRIMIHQPLISGQIIAPAIDIKIQAEEIRKIRDQVGDQKVICGLSGGVDSSVAAVLIHEAIGDQLTCVFVDHGLLRLGEAEQVVSMFRDHYNMPLIHADESDLFLGALEGVSDPEVKRKTIGRLFIDVFQKHAAEVGGATFLAQGTLYPDVIESVSFSGGPSVTIKSHHNVGGLPEKMGLKLVEPLRELFKDEVRALGRELGLPQSFIGRHPFPGPGLAIRCPGEITREKLDILRRADAVYIDQIRKHGLYDEIWQAFAAILPVKTVGVMGDGRTYDYALSLRAVTSVDGMTADYYPFTHDFLSETATRIINEVQGINRVMYDVTSKPPGTIEME